MNRDYLKIIKRGLGHFVDVVITGVYDCPTSGNTAVIIRCSGEKFTSTFFRVVDELCVRYPLDYCVSCDARGLYMLIYSCDNEE